MEETEASQSAEWIDAIKENPLLFAVLLVVLCIVVFLAMLAIYLLGSNVGGGAGLPPLPTTTIQFATSTPTISSAATTPPSPGNPAVDVLSVQGGSGTLVTITGQNWTPGDTLVIRIEDPTGSQAVQPLFANVQVTNDGTFIASFILPANTGWDNLTSIQVIVESPATGQQFSAEFNILASTPTATSPVPTVAPPPGSTPTPTTVYESTPGDWVGEYYANPNLVGAPRLVRNERVIDFDWGLDAPAPSLPADGFSVRWTRNINFDPAIYHFRILATDGVRLWVNEDLVVDQWFAGSQREIVVDYPVLYGGTYSLRLEYVNFAGPARVGFRWEKFPLPPPPGPFPPYAHWLGEYYANPDLFGSPSFGRNDPEINFNWGTSAPAPGLPNDNFSIRWQRTVDFEATNYRFYITVNDGVRFWVDDQLLIDEWRDGETREVSDDLQMSAGPHELRVEYYKHTGAGEVRLRWEKASVATATPTPTATPVGYFPDWRGDYWANTGLSGNPAVVRNDPQISFNWGFASPDPAIPPDNFSARWSRSFQFENGVYRFTAESKDGLRFYVDGALILDRWSDTPVVRTDVIDLNLNGRHWLVVEYYNRSGEAVARFSWQQVTATPTPTATATASPTLLPTPTSSSTLTPSPTSTLFPTPTPTETFTPTPTETLTPAPSPTEIDTSTPVPTSTETPTFTPTPTVPATSLPVETITPEATASG